MTSQVLSADTAGPDSLHYKQEGEGVDGEGICGRADAATGKLVICSNGSMFPICPKTPVSKMLVVHYWFRRSQNLEEGPGGRWDELPANVPAIRLHGTEL